MKKIGTMNLEFFNFRLDHVPSSRQDTARPAIHRREPMFKSSPSSIRCIAGDGYVRGLNIDHVDVIVSKQALRKAYVTPAPIANEVLVVTHLA